jgi:flagellar biosynthesis/type III secretory pathway protein FliH
LSTDSAHARLELGQVPSLVRLFAGNEAELREGWKAGSLEQAFERGRRAGEQSTNAALAATLDAALGEIENLRETALARLAQDAAGLALEIARELVRVETRAQRHDIERIVRETLASAAVGRGACVVHLHPHDARRLESVHFRARTQIEADPAVPEGDVHVTTPQGLLVRDLEHALDTIGERLRQELQA